MNKVYISGKIVDQPFMRMEGENQHMILKLRVSHKKRNGERRFEDYRVNAWNRIAQWGMTNLVGGQIVAVQGYLTQNISNNHATEVTAEEFLPMRDPLPHQNMEENDKVSDPHNDMEPTVPSE